MKLYLQDSKYVSSHWDFFSPEEKKTVIDLIPKVSEENLVVVFKDDIIYREKDSFLLSKIIKNLNLREVDLGDHFYNFVLHHPDGRVRANSLENLSKNLFFKYKKKIELFLSDADNRVRANAIKLFWDYEPRKAEKFLLKMLEDQDMWMKISAMYVISSLDLSVYMDKILSLLEDWNDLVREWAYKTSIKIVPANEKYILAQKFERNYFQEENHFLRKIMVEFLLEFSPEFLLKVIFTQEKPYIKHLILKGLIRKNFQYMEWEKLISLYESLSSLEEELKLGILRFIAIQQSNKGVKINFFLKIISDNGELHRVREEAVSFLVKEKEIDKKRILEELSSDNIFYNIIVKEFTDER